MIYAYMKTQHDAQWANTTGGEAKCYINITLKTHIS